MAGGRHAGGRGHGRDGALWLAYLGIWLFGAGLLAIALSHRVHRWDPPPVPPVSASRPVSPAAARSAPVAGAAARTAAAGAAARTAAAGAARSAPVTVRIPAIGVAAKIISVGLNGHGGVAVPPLATPMLVGWYDRGAAPGQAGAAVLLGHVDSALTGPAVFYKLGELRPGNLVYVTRKDNRTVVFTVTSVALYPETDFPSLRVYGFTAAPTLRLVTCGGDFDWQTHHYLDRTVVFARYAGQLR
jgi:Sortase domain